MSDLLINSITTLIAASLVGVTSNLFYPLLNTYVIDVLADFLAKVLPSRYFTPQKSYHMRIDQLMRKLEDASSDLDDVLQEIERVTRQRQDVLQELETKTTALSMEEKKLRDAVEAWKSVPLPAADLIVQATAEGERRSARRDYALFLAGVIVSIITTIVFRLVFGI